MSEVSENEITVKCIDLQVKEWLEECKASLGITLTSKSSCAELKHGSIETVNTNHDANLPRHLLEQKQLQVQDQTTMEKRRVEDILTNCI